MPPAKSTYCFGILVAVCMFFFWVHLLSLLAAVECLFGPIWMVLSSVLVLLVQVCVYLNVCLNFLFSFGAVITLFLARLPLEDSYQSGVCDISSAGWFGGLITLEHGVSMPGVLAPVVRWCTRGAVLIIAGSVGCVDVW